MKKITQLLLLICLFISGNVKAQTQVIFQEKKENSFLFTYNNALSPNQEVNHMIRKLAESSGKGVYRTEYIFHYEQALRITKTGTTLKISVSNEDLYCSGDISYKGFPLTDLLLPSKLSFKAKLTTQQGQLVKQFNFNDVQISEGSAELSETTYTDSTSSTNYKLSISDQGFYYTIASMNAFNDKVFLIDDYYATDAQLALVFQNLKTVIPEDVENIHAHNMMLQKIEGVIIQTEQKNLGHRLNLHHFDPSQLQNKIQALKQQTLLTRGAINQQLATLDATFYNKGLQFLVNNNIQQARTYFEKSLQVNPLFAPANLQLAKMDLDKGNTANAEGRLKEIILKSNPDPDTKQKAYEYLDNLLSMYGNEGYHYLNQRQFEKALNTFQYAKRLCHEVPGMICKEDILRGIADAKYGIYKNYLIEALANLEKGKLDVAENLVNDAKRYQSQNSGEIKNTEEADSILKKIKNQHYQDLIKSAKNFLTNKHFRKALDDLNHASNLESVYGLAQHSEFIAMRKKAGKPVLLENIEAGLMEVANNNLIKARTITNEVIDNSKLYQLNGDKEIEKKLAELKSKILTQECINAQAKVDQLFEEGIKAKIALNYIAAQNYFEQAINHAGSNADCGINTTAIRDENLNIIPASTYQKLFNQASDLVKNNQQQQALEKYKECDRYYFQFSINSFGINHPDLYNFAMSQPSNGFMAYVSDHFQGIKELDKSLALQKELLRRGYPKNYLKNSQTSLGVLLAIKDKAQNPSGNPKTNALNYTGGDKKLKALSKAYIKQWKRS